MSSLLSSWREAWWYTDRYGAGEELRVLYLDLQAAESEKHWQWHTSSNRATPLNTAIPYEAMEAILIQTNTIVKSSQEKEIQAASGEE